MAVTKQAETNELTAPSVTVVVTPRERFGVAVESLQSVVDHTQEHHRHIYIDAGSPKPIAEKQRTICIANGFRYVSLENFMTPTAASYMGQRLVDTPFTVFLDNDVVVSDGWLGALVTCAEETGADVVAPLTCQRLPLHHEIHQAGGEFAADRQEFFEISPDRRRITDVHVLQGQKVDDVDLERGETQCCEFHCALVRGDAFVRFGQLDENLLATKEHIDFCMTVWAGGGRVMFEPSSVVTYLFPSRERPLNREDWPFFMLRWSPAWQRASLAHFQQKWSLYEDPYFAKREGMLEWRLSEGIAKPLVKKLPFLSRSYRLKTAAVRLLTYVLHRWSDNLVARHNPGLVMRQAIDGLPG